MCKTPWWHHLVLVILLRTVKSHTAVTDVCALQKDEFLRLIINSIRNDLISRNEAFQCLALGFIGNGQSLSTIAVLPKHTSSLCICYCLLLHEYLVDTIPDMVCSWRTGNGFLAGSGCHGPCGISSTPASQQRLAEMTSLLCACQHCYAVLGSKLPLLHELLLLLSFLNTTPDLLQAASKQHH